jgi:hypothetical protein
MSDQKCTSLVRIRAEVEIVGSTYGPDWSIGAIQKQAKEEGRRALMNMLQKAGGRVIGEPTITHVIVTEEK